MDEIAKDPRFAHVPKDPKFRRIPKSERKVKIDKRFESMFKDKNFKVTYTIDKRGRPITKSSAEDLEKYYELSSGSEDDESPSTSMPKPKPVKPSKKSQKSSKSKEQIKDEFEDPESAEDSKSIAENERQLKLRRKNETNKIDVEIKNKLKDLSVDYARGEGALMSDSSSDESSDDASEDEGIDHMWGEMDREAESTEEATSRLAACNMDWDRIRAVDLMVLFSSFVPPGGLIHSVTIYPSDFGVQRLREEELRGPMELGEATEANGDGEEDEEGNDFQRERLRQYQLNRLKYFYAVIICDSRETANKIYSECDGHEYESTATKIDLRFIPEDMEFDQEPKEICDSLPQSDKYQPRQFTTTALQQVRVECTWDETKLDRQEITKKINSGKIDDIDENDIKVYLASGSSDEEETEGIDADETGVGDAELDTKNPLEKYKSLLKSIEQQEEKKKKKDGELEFTWGLGSKEKAEKLVQKKLKDAEQLTPFEQFLEKRKEKKKAKREEKRNKKESEESGSDTEDSIPSDVDLNDPYFAEEIQKTKSKTLKKKTKGKSGIEEEESDGESQKKAELELLLLDKEDEEKRHFDMKKIEETEALTKSKKKRLSKKQKGMTDRAKGDEFEVNVEDPRFNALFTSHHFNIDPADSHYRKTKGTEAFVKEKLKRRADGDVGEEMPNKSSKSRKTDGMSPDLAALIKSVKRNTKNVSRPIK